MVVVTRWIAENRIERFSAVVRAIDRSVHHVDDVGVARIGGDAAKVPAALPDARLSVHVRPARAVIIGTIDAALAGSAIYVRVDAMRSGGRNRQTDAADARRKTVRQLRPRSLRRRCFCKARRRGRWMADRRSRAAFASARARRRRRWGCPAPSQARLRQCRRPCRGPCVHVAPPSVVLKTPRSRVRAVLMSERGDVDGIGIARIDDDCANLPRVGQADVRPRATAVGRLVHPVAVCDIGAHVGFTAADVDDVRIARSYRDRADRGDLFVVEDRAARFVRRRRSTKHPRQPRRRRSDWDRRGRRLPRGRVHRETGR